MIAFIRPICNLFVQFSAIVLPSAPPVDPPGKPFQVFDARKSIRLEIQHLAVNGASVGDLAATRRSWGNKNLRKTYGKTYGKPMETPMEHQWKTCGSFSRCFSMDSRAWAFLCSFKARFCFSVSGAALPCLLLLGNKIIYTYCCVFPPSLYVYTRVNIKDMLDHGIYFRVARVQGSIPWVGGLEHPWSIDREMQGGPPKQ